MCHGREQILLPLLHLPKAQCKGAAKPPDELLPFRDIRSQAFLLQGFHTLGILPLFP